MHDDARFYTGDDRLPKAAVQTGLQPEPATRARPGLSAFLTMERPGWNDRKSRRAVLRHDPMFLQRTMICSTALMRSFVCLAWIELSACSPKSQPAEHYRARGVVTAIERTGDDVVLTIQHERIASFRNREGQVSSMPSMKMNFRVDEASQTRSLVVSDKIDFEFEVRWQSGMPLHVLRIEKLAQSTALELGAAR